MNAAEAALAEAAGGTRKGAPRGEDGSSQALKPYAAKVLMKVLYAARYARFDLLRAVWADVLHR